MDKQKKNNTKREKYIKRYILNILDGINFNNNSSDDINQMLLSLLKNLFILYTQVVSENDSLKKQNEKIIAENDSLKKQNNSTNSTNPTNCYGCFI